MSLQFSIDVIWATLLLATRLGVVLFLTPLLGGLAVPGRIRILIILGLALWLVLTLQLHSSILPHNLLEAARAFTHELIWGGLLGFGILCAFAVFLFGGRLLDLQMGFGVANLYDPVNHTQTPLLGMFLHMFAICYFFTLNAHHVVLRALVYSLEVIQLGMSPLDIPMPAILMQFGLIFSLGLVVVGAAVVCVFLVDIGMSIASRVLPQANIFILSMPVKIFTGLSVLMLSIYAMRPVMARIFATIFSYWEIVLPAHKL